MARVPSPCDLATSRHQFNVDTSQARNRLRRAVVAAVRQVSPVYVVRGSFGHGDFHLLGDNWISFSDLDLLYPGVREPERFHCARQVQKQVATQCDLQVRVSVQPADMYTRLSPSDSRYLSIGEYLRHRFEYSGDLLRSSYLLAKTTLSVLRQSADERYRETARRLGSPTAMLALHIKLGKEASFDISEAQELLARGPSEATEFLEMLENNSSPAEVQRKYLDELALRTEVPIWLRTLVASLVEGLPQRG